jgi:lambda repressor-like predicted transcriptional regulator
MRIITVQEKHMNYKQRKTQMAKLRKHGWTLQQIANKYGISKTRIHQILGCTKRGTS